MKRICILSLFLLCISLIASAQTSTAQPAIAKLARGPYLQVATNNSMTIRWRTDQLTRSRVRYGMVPGDLKMIAEDSMLVTEHVVKLVGLAPATKYYYSIGGIKDTLQGNADNYFVTLPNPGVEGKYRVGVFGDCGNNSSNQRNVRDQFLKYLGDDYLHSWILLGDNAYSDGTDAQYQYKFFDIYKNDLLKKYPLFPAPGNHDYHDVEYTAASAQLTHQVPYYKIFSMPVNGEAGGHPSGNQAFYSFDIGNIHFISLDSYGKENNTRMYDTLGPQVEWLKKDLEVNKNKGWVVAYWHHPPYTMGSHDSDKENELIRIRENFIRILERNGVDLILCGHSHVYERSKLLKGHYAAEATFNEGEHVLNRSTGLYNGSDNSCPYIKSAENDHGTVYVVTGSAGQVGGQKATYPHDAMYYSNSTIGGAGMIEVEGNRLDFKWVCADGQVRDSFTMMKEVNRKTYMKVKAGTPVTLSASFVGAYEWNVKHMQGRSIQLTPGRGKHVFTVKDKYGCIRDSFEVEVSR